MKQGHKAAHASILAVDYGRARIGLAIADAEARLARPLATFERVNRNEDMRRLRELARDHRVKLVVMGLPLRLDGTRGEMAEEAQRFAQRVTKQIGLPVEMVDERLTSWEAERLMEEELGRVGRPKGGRRSSLEGPSNAKNAKKGSAPTEGPSVDAWAAAMILREYLGRPGTPEDRSRQARSQ